ncbi:antitoxin [Oryzobacter telluris]|uniref:antitoxin n=1 Tax=Oryzobacter telluris TaxID=3149179 RepID=UPI00370DC94F
MGLLDDAKAKLEQLAHDNPEQVESISDQVIERGGDAVDQATGGKYAGQIDQGQAKADDAIGQ